MSIDPSLTLPNATHRDKRLFPLYFNPIESLFVEDDRPNYPMAFIVQMNFSGNVNRAAFDEALPLALARHPLLNSHRQVAKQGLPCWVPASTTMPLVDWGKEGDPIELPRGESINLEQEVGLRIWIREGSDSTVMTMQFHHSSCDGIGGYRFIGDFLALYGQRTSSTPESYELATLDPNLLRHRKLRMTEYAFRGMAWPLFWRCWRECFRLFGRKISPLAPIAIAPAQSISANSPYPQIVVSSFDRETHARLTSEANELHVGLNDWLIAALFKTLHDWNSERKSTTNRGWLRIMMPTDMRDAEDYGMPAANLVSYTFLARSMRESRDAKALCPGICRETDLIKKEKRGLLFGDALAGTMGFRWLLPFLASGKRCLATAVLSNAGDPSKRFIAKLPRSKGRIVAGNLILENITGVPPLRINTNVTISIITYMRKLEICLRCCPRLFSAADAKRLSDMYTQSVRELLD
jgi:hypothetical protein